MFAKKEPTVYGEEYLTYMDQFAITIVEMNHFSDAPLVEYLNKWCVINNCIPVSFSISGFTINAVVRKK